MTFVRPAVIDEALHGACNLKAMIFIPLIASVFSNGGCGTEYMAIHASQWNNSR